MGDMPGRGDGTSEYSAAVKLQKLVAVRKWAFAFNDAFAGLQ
jgi:hypothetical protein